MIKNNLPTKKSRFKQGFYKVKNKEKYRGDLSKVIYRSSWELKFFKECDNDQDIVKWEAEPVWLAIKYISPIDKKTHTYYPDVYCEKSIDGKVYKFIIEIKPKQFLIKPKMPNYSGLVGDLVKRKAKNAYILKKRKFDVIYAKHVYAKIFAKRNKMKYIFLTETYVNR